MTAAAAAETNRVDEASIRSSVVGRQLSMAGLLVVDKPAGWTSHDVVAKIRRIVGIKRVGHAGTLDPGATGVLVIAVGQATRLIEFIQEGMKVYRGTIVLGLSTTTDDAEGEPVHRSDPSGVSESQVRAVLDRFVGTIEQTPPQVSAIKVEGRRSYALARAGESVELASRPVTITRIDLLSFDSPEVALEVECGSGTYIRSLARDVGAALGVGGHLRDLQRLRVGRFSLEDAVTLETLEASMLVGDISRWLRPLEEAVGDLTPLSVSDATALSLRQGKTVPADGVAVRAAAFDGRGRLVAVVQRSGDRWQPAKVFDGIGDRDV